MKTSGEKEHQAASCSRDDVFGVFDSPEVPAVSTIKSGPHHSDRKNNIIRFSENVRIQLLTAENQRLKNLVEDLILDKQCQARRIGELNDEKKQLKKALAELILDSPSRMAHLL